MIMQGKRSNGKGVKEKRGKGGAGKREKKGGVGKKEKKVKRMFVFDHI